MSDSEHSIVTYTSIPSPVEDYLDIGSPEVNGPLSPDYVPGPEELEQAPLSPEYVPGPEEPEQAPLLPDYVPGPEDPEQAPLSPDYPMYPEYIPPEDDVFPAKEQPLPIASTPTADSPGYIFEFDPNGDPMEDEEEDPKEEPADYPADSIVVALPTVDHVPPKEDELVGASEEIAPTTLQWVNQRVTDLSTIVDQETIVMYSMMKEAQDDRFQLRGRVNLLYKDRPVHHHLAVMAADRRRQGVIKELLAADHKRQVQLTKELRLLKGLQTQMIKFQKHHGPAKGLARPDAPGEAGSSS
nr:hypothetical protein [Tanacetum cinerariifolium]